MNTIGPMIPRGFREAARKTLRVLGYEVVQSQSRNSVTGLLRHARSVGLDPETVIDVGAAFGRFTLQCRTVFPRAKYLLIEPLAEFEQFLRALAHNTPGVDYVLAAATAESGNIIINVHSDWRGSSAYTEQEGPSVDGAPRTVPAATLDALVEAKHLRGPFLLKLDTQGAELDVLSGAQRVLADTDYLLTEVSFFECLKGAPLFPDVVEFLRSRGFEVYDVCGMQYRPLDNALSHLDVAFVKETGFFRKHHVYATPEQRTWQLKNFQSLMRREMARMRRRPV